MAQTNLTHKPDIFKRLDELRNQIYINLVNRGLVSEQDEGMVKAELNVYRFHVWKIIFEEMSDWFGKQTQQDDLV